jgi:hypothetical protein
MGGEEMLASFRGSNSAFTFFPSLSLLKNKFDQRNSPSFHRTLFPKNILSNMFASTCVLLALASSSLATVFVRFPFPLLLLATHGRYLQLTSPTASTTFTGGQQATISWIDNGQAPALAAFGNALIGIYTGNAQQQVST